jgi:hypothetical protein
MSEIQAAYWAGFINGDLCAATYIDGKLIVPTSPKKFLETLRYMASEPVNELSVKL